METISVKHSKALESLRALILKGSSYRPQCVMNGWAYFDNVSKQWASCVVLAAYEGLVGPLSHNALTNLDSAEITKLLHNNLVASGLESGIFTQLEIPCGHYYHEQNFYEAWLILDYESETAYETATNKAATLVDDTISEALLEYSLAPLLNLLIHLNDKHKWARGRIAEWLLQANYPC